MINNINRLDAAQLKELEELSALCKKKDGSIPNTYPHILEKTRNLPASLLYYAQQKLVGFLSAYFFYDDAVEISILIDPAYRRQGIAKQLIVSIMPIIESQHFEKLIFSNPAHVNDVWLRAQDCAYLHSEYYMERNELTPLLDYKQPLTFHTATKEDIAQLCVFDEACFPARQTNLIERFQYLMDDREYQIIVAYENNQPIGKLHIRWQAKGAAFSDIAILPNKQGKGLGSSLIIYCINLALSKGKPHINLDVETHNDRALKLYTRLGFLTKNACDYWSINLQLLKNKWCQ